MAKKNKQSKGATAPAQPSVVVNKLVVKAANRNVLDIGKWRSAMKAAEKGKTTALYDLYDDLLIDGVLSDAIDKRIKAVLSTNIIFIDAEGEEVPEITEIIDSLAWEELITRIMMTLFWGRSAVELSFAPFGCFPIPPKHINLIDKVISLEQGDNKGISYEFDPFLLVLGKTQDLGLLLKAAPYAIYKRGGFGDWSQWIELFGMPHRLGKYNTYDPQSKQLLEEAFEKFGAAPYLIAPNDTTIEHIETSSGNGIAYDDFRKACNEEILITILGQTMTTVQGDKGARSLGEVHMEVEAGKHKSDLRYCQRILNEYLRPRLEARGYKVAGGKFVYPKEHQLPEVSELVMLSDIMDIPKVWLHEQYGIPMPSEGEEIARRQNVSPMGSLMPLEPDDDAEPTPEPKEEPKPKKDESIKNKDSESLWQRFIRFFGIAPREMTLGAKVAGQALMTLSDIKAASAATISDRLIERIAEAEGKGDFDPELFAWTSNQLITALEQGFKRNIQHADAVLSYAYNLQVDTVITAMEANLYRFSIGKTLAEVQALNEAFRKSKSFSEFKMQAKTLTTDFNERWAKTEYNTALLAAESAANYQDLMRKSKIFPYWKYKTVGDSKVRQEHAALDGLILHYQDPRWKEIFPPNGWGCRCKIEPVMLHEGKQVNIEEMQKQADRYMESIDWQNAKQSGWGTNRGEALVVFDTNQQYLYKMPTHSARSIDDLTSAHYGLRSVQQLMKEAPTDTPTTSLTADELWNTYANKDGDRIILRDYSGRTVFMDRIGWERHTTGDHEYRISLFNAALEAVKSPDEVWINRQQYNSNLKNSYKRIRQGNSTEKDEHAVVQDGYSLIKYYKDLMIVVRYRVIPDKGVKISTWFDVNLTKKNIRKHRRGILVQHK